MIDRFSAHWWLFLLRGLAAIAFGIIALADPDIAIAVLVIVFGAYALVDGAIAIVSSIRGSHTDNRWWLLLLEGVASLVAGIVAFVWPDVVAFAFAYLLGAWAILTGAFAIVSALQLRSHMPDEWMWILSGGVSVALGILIMLLPAAGLFVWSYMIGIYALIAGLALVAVAFRLRGHHTSSA